MQNEQAATPSDRICVGGPIVNGPVTIRCHCGAPMDNDTVWQMCVQERPGEIGEDAWGRCPAGHEFHHPMIYPEFVHTVLAWRDHHDGADAEASSDLYALLDEIVWRPHRRIVHGPMYAGGRPRILWCAWDRLDLYPLCGEPEYWRREWPDLWNAAHRDPATPQ